MAVSYEGSGASAVGTMTCDRGCGATWSDGKAETGWPLIHARASEAGWGFVRPNAYQQWDVCPDCMKTGRRDW